MKVIIFLGLFFSLKSEAIVTTPSLIASKFVTNTDLIFFKNLFEKSALLNSMECEIKTRLTQNVRKFKDQSNWTETVELSYLPYRYDSSLQETIMLTSGSKYGSRTINHLEFGPLEEFRVEFNDSKESFIEFSHDGRGHLTSFLFADIYRLYPCRVRR